MFKKILFLLLFLFILVHGAWGIDTEKGVVYYNAWEMDKVEDIAHGLLTKGSLKADEEWFLGLFYFYNGNYEKATYHLGNASHKDSKNKKWSDFYTFVKATGEITRDFYTYESEHFILRLDGKDIILADYALSALEKGYWEVGRDLECFPSRKVLVEIYPSSEDFNLASSLSKRDMEVSGAIGICKFNRLMAVSPRCLAFGYRWLDTLVHEYTHFVVNIKSNGKCPLWLHEGIAKNEERRWISNEKRNYLIPVYSSLLKEALDNDEMISFDRMSPSLVKLDTQKEVTLAYAQVATAVDYMVSFYSIGILPEILTELKENDDYKKVIEKLLGKKYSRFQKDWLKFIESMNLTIIPGIMMDSLKIKVTDADYEMEEYLKGELRIYIRLGDRFKKKGKLKIALHEYEKALKSHPYNPVILNRIGKIYFAMDDLIKAEESFKKAIQMNPNYVSSYTNLGDLYFYRRDFTRALDNYQESNRINPFNPSIHKNMGLIYYSNDKEKALREWQIAEKLTPRDLELKGWLMNLKGK